MVGQTVIPVTAVSLETITGYTLTDDKFAVKVDMNQKLSDIFNGNFQGTKIQMTDDMLNASNPNQVADGYEDDQEFYMAYVNNRGIQTAYNALLKFEHNVTGDEVLKALPGLWESYVPDNFESSVINAAESFQVGHVNATAPFQTLIEHWNTLPNAAGDRTEMFVTNHYVALMAYSTTGSDQFLDSGDDMYLGYTFAFNYLQEAINDFIETETGTADFIAPYNAVPFFTNPSTGVYEFGVEYQNLFVVWQAIDMEDFNTRAGHIIFGGDIAAMTLLDSLKFTYRLTYTELGPSAIDPTITEVWADIQTTYDFGETNLLITDESAWPGGFTPSDSDSFLLNDPEYTFTLPSGLADAIQLYDPSFPDTFTVQLPDFAFYLNDDAKRRIAWDAGGYGMIMTTMTNVFALDLKTRQEQVFTHQTNETDTDDYVNATIDVLATGNKAFHTSFSNKLTYTLTGTGIHDGSYMVAVEYWPADATFAQGLGWFYFKLELGLAGAFLYILAKEMGLDTVAQQGRILSVDHSAYFTLTAFWRWSGGAINHDPTYTAMSGEKEEGEETDTASSEGAFTPGFEFLVAVLAVVPIALYKKRK